jgi:hypothetical protein
MVFITVYTEIKTNDQEIAPQPRTVVFNDTVNGEKIFDGTTLPTDKIVAIYKSEDNMLYATHKATVLKRGTKTFVTPFPSWTGKKGDDNIKIKVHLEEINAIPDGTFEEVNYTADGITIITFVIKKEEPVIKKEEPVIKNEEIVITDDEIPEGFEEESDDDKPSEQEKLAKQKPKQDELAKQKAKQEELAKQKAKEEELAKQKAEEERAKILKEYQDAKKDIETHNKQAEVLHMKEYKALYSLAKTYDAPPEKGMNSLLRAMCPKATNGPFNAMRTDEESLPVLQIFEIMAQLTYINDGKNIDNKAIANKMQGFYKFWAEENKDKANAFKQQADDSNMLNVSTKAEAKVEKAVANSAKVASKETEVFADVFSSDKAGSARKTKGAAASQQPNKRHRKADTPEEKIFQDSGDEKN